MCAFCGVERIEASASLGWHLLFFLSALFYFQQVNGERLRGAVERPKFRSSLIS
jgi:hypothetical protein